MMLSSARDSNIHSFACIWLNKGNQNEFLTNPKMKWLDGGLEPLTSELSVHCSTTGANLTNFWMMLIAYMNVVCFYYDVIVLELRCNRAAWVRSRFQPQELIDVKERQLATHYLYDCTMLFSPPPGCSKSPGLSITRFIVAIC